jgi:hypothetical protein
MQLRTEALPPSDSASAPDCRRAREGEDPSDTPHTAIFGFPLAGYRLKPPKEFFHQLPPALTDLVAGVSGGASVSSAAPRSVAVLRYVRRSALFACRPTKSWVSYALSAATVIR